MITFYCPNCNNAISVSDDVAGKVGQCSCGHKMRVPIKFTTGTASSVSIWLPAYQKLTSVIRRRIVWVLSGLALVILVPLVILVAGGFRPSKTLPSQSVDRPKVREPVHQIRYWAQALSALDITEQGFMKERPDTERQIEKYNAGKRYAKNFFWTSDVSFDVEKTNSLVSPYTAVIQFRLYYTNSDWITKEAYDRTTIKDCGPVIRFNYKCLFVFQEGKWLTKDVRKQDDSNPSNWVVFPLPDGVNKILADN